MERTKYEKDNDDPFDVVYENLNVYDKIKQKIINRINQQLVFLNKNINTLQHLLDTPEKLKFEIERYKEFFEKNYEQLGIMNEKYVNLCVQQVLTNAPPWKSEKINVNIPMIFDSKGNLARYNGDECY
jgi:hypothetical protein